MSICSLDTNILLYATNEDAPEHEVCKDFFRQIIEDPAEWVIADQVYLELYRPLRNPRVMSNPLSAKPAAKHVAILRYEMGISHCGYASECWKGLIRRLGADDFPYKRTPDAVLAAALLSYGVKIFYTRNTKDFEASGFESVINPVDK